MPRSLWFALAFLREPRRWLTAALAVAVGTIGMIMADGFIERIFIDFREDIVRSHYGHLQVQPREQGHALPAGSRDGLASVRDDVERVLEAFPGAVVAGRLGFAGLASHGERTVSFIGEGVEPRQEVTLSRALGFPAGRGLASPDAADAVLGEGLARSLGAGVGDTVTLMVNTPGGGFNGVETRVIGIFRSASKAYDDRALRLPLRVAQKLTRAEALSRLIAVLPRTDDTPAAAKLLGSALAQRPVVVRQWHEMADFYTKSVELFRRQLAAVRVVIVAVVLLWISNSMARNVMDRTREIGTMMALGRTRAAVARSFLGEGLAIGVAGALLGVAAGAALAAAISAIGIPMPAPPGMAHGFIGGVQFTAGIASFAGACAALSAIIASVAPAWRAARMPIVEALRSAR